MDYSTIILQVLSIVGIIVAFVNIITEVVKNVTGMSGARVINMFVLVISVILSVAVFVAYWQIKQMQITWYLILTFIIIGFMVAYAAMFGYDKLLSLFKKTD